MAPSCGQKTFSQGIGSMCRISTVSTQDVFSLSWYLSDFMVPTYGLKSSASKRLTVSISFDEASEEPTYEKQQETKNMLRKGIATIMVNDDGGSDGGEWKMFQKSCTTTS